MTRSRVPYFPQEDSKLRATSLDRRRGGNVVNSLEVLQQLDVTSGREHDLILLCVLPSRSSPGTKLVRDSLSERVQTQHCIYREDNTEPASSYIIQAVETGSRTIVNHNALPEMTIAEFQEKVDDINDSEAGRMWFHFEGREVETSVACMQWLRERYPDVLISAEIEKPNRPGLEQMAAEADVVFYSKTWAQAQGHESAIELLKAQAATLPRARLLFCTWGEEGAAVYHPLESDLVLSKLLIQGQDSRIVDTVGAGDTFIAGALYAILNQLSSTHIDPHPALIVGTNLAGHKVFQQGFRDLSVSDRTISDSWNRKNWSSSAIPSGMTFELVVPIYPQTRKVD